MILNNQIAGNIINERIIEVPYVLMKVNEYFPLNNQSNYKILDFGNVESLISLQLQSLGYNVIGNDLRDYELRHNNLIHYIGDILNTYIEEKPLDCIIQLSSLEHTGLNQYGNKITNIQADRKIMEKFNNLLKKNGKVILTVPFNYSFIIKDWYRMYNIDQINGLIKDLFIIKEYQIYKKNKEIQEWNKIDFKDIEYYDPVNDEIEIVGCFILEKTGSD